MLFCKPTLRNKTLYEYPFELDLVIQFRSVILKKDLNLIDHWINDARSKFWPVTGPVEQVKNAYQMILMNPDSHSFIGFSDEQMICVIDIYRVLADPLGQHIEAKYHDCGMRLLMAPSEQPIAGLSRKVMEAFMHYFFSFSAARYLYAEPDIHNTKACRLLEKCGFSFLQNIMLDTKAASLYMMTRNQFHATRRRT